MSTPDLSTQAEISAEIADLSAGTDPSAIRPRLDYSPYRSSLLRHPTKDLHQVDPEGVELWSPCFSHRDVDPLGPI